MSRSRRRVGRAAALAAAAVAALGLGACRSGGSLAVGATGLKYDQPGQLVPLGPGRNLNLRCIGKGSPTVIFEAGYGATSEAWSKVQPAVARLTRTCAYDRAGYGFSSPGPLPRDGAAIVRDLDRALQAAGVRGPYVLAAHSAGGLYARLFAARHVNDVQGIVFLDSTPERLGPPLPPGADDGLGGIRRRAKRCLAAAQQPNANPDSPEFAGCIPGKSTQSRAIATDPATWTNQISELDEIMRGSSDQVSRTGDLLKNIPVYVFAASETVERNRNPIAFDTPSAWLIRQQQLADRFITASQQTVLSSHLIMVERPEVVIAALEEVVRAARGNRPPAPLGSSESAPSTDQLPNLPEDVNASTWSGGEVVK